MTDREATHRAMARQARQKLRNSRPRWKPAAPRLVPAHEQVVKLPGAFNATGAPPSSPGSQGCTAAKARAIVAAGHVSGPTPPHSPENSYWPARR